MRISDNKDIEETQYGKQMNELADKISDMMQSVGQGYIFTVLPGEDDIRPHFSSFGIKSKDYTSFWAALYALIKEARNSIPEDDISKFREGFMPMVILTMKECFPMIHLEGGFYDELNNNMEEK